MPVFISMLRGVNLGAHNRIKMDALRAMYQSLKLEGARTYVQSGNVIFRTREKNTAKLATKIQDAIEKTFKCRPDVILRTTEELKRAAAATPFASSRQLEPGKILVSFLAAEPAADTRARLAALVKAKSYPEELHLVGRELYIYFPNGAGKSKLPWSQLERLVNVTGTARNWNSVLAMLEIAEQMEAEQ
jgi:uncharacterized protein (DUF1697 family)